MARTSRKGGATTQIAAPTERIWNVAVYARLSKEDNGLKNGDSIETQIELISNHIHRQDHLHIAGIYPDNGEYSGNFDRPQWNRLMDDIRADRIDCIAVKDLSRFSRNYIETCEYLDKIFPFMGIRFISVNDGYDSANSGASGLVVSLKALMNDTYARDISRKCLSSKKIQRERGEFSGAFPPYGFKKSETVKGKLVIDEETAPVVIQIFEWKAEGLGNKTICKKLDALGITCPSVRLQQLYYEKGQDYFKGTIWQPGSIIKILSRKVYLGHLEQGRTYQARCENAPQKQQCPRSEWCLIENTHDPIISTELWDAAHDVMAAKRAGWSNKPKYEHTENVLAGFMVCGVCGTKMTRYAKPAKGKMYYYYECRLKRQHPEGQLYRRINDRHLRDTAFSLIQKQLSLAADMSHVIEKRIKQFGNPQELLKRNIAAALRDVETYSDRQIRLYEDYVGKLLDENEYVRIKRDYDARVVMAKERVEALERKLSVMGDVDTTANSWLVAVRDFLDPKELTRDLLTALVDKIIMKSADEIDIAWNHRDDFALLEACADAGDLESFAEEAC